MGEDPVQKQGELLGELVVLVPPYDEVDLGRDVLDEPDLHLRFGTGYDESQVHLQYLEDELLLFQVIHDLLVVQSQPDVHLLQGNLLYLGL